VPDAATYSQNAVNTLGKVNTTTGYWAHGLQVRTMSIHIPSYANNEKGETCKEIDIKCQKLNFVKCIYS
jgi:hypothetical protein